MDTKTLNRAKKFILPLLIRKLTLGFRKKDIILEEFIIPSDMISVIEFEPGVFEFILSFRYENEKETVSSILTEHTINILKLNKKLNEEEN